MRIRPFATFTLLALALPAKGRAEPPSKRSMADLIQALGSTDPGTREAAQFEVPERFWDWTADDIAKLEAATHLPDVEVAAASTRLLLKVRKLGTLGNTMARVRGWNPAVLLRRDSGMGEGALRSVLDAWTSGTVPEHAWSCATDLALEDSWLGFHPGPLIVRLLREHEAHPGCRASIVRLCSSEDRGTAERAALAAGWMELGEALPAIGKALQDDRARDSREKLEHAAECLGIADDAELMKSLAKSSSPEARRSCARIIRRQLPPQRSPLLAGLVLDPEFDVREQAFYASCELGTPADLKVILSVVLTGRRSGGVSLRKFRGQFDAKLFAEWARSTDLDARRKAAIYLAFARDPHDLLEVGLHDPDPLVRNYAALSAGQAGDLSSVPSLIELLEDRQSKYTPETAALALGMMKATKSLPALSKLLKSGPPEHRFDALYGIAMLGDPASLPDILEATNEDDSSIERVDEYIVCVALAYIDGPEAMARLRDPKGNHGLRQRKRGMLANHGEPQDLPLLQVKGEPRFGYHEAMGTTMDDLFTLLTATEGERVREPAPDRGKFAINARHATPEQATEKLIGWLEAAAKRDDGYADHAMVSLVALGRTTLEDQQRILRRVRASADEREELPPALCEALCRANEPEAWEAYTREIAVENDIRTEADVRALITSRGLELIANRPPEIYGRVAKGHVLSIRRLAYRLHETGSPVLDGKFLRFMDAREALRWWAERLDR